MGPRAACRTEPGPTGWEVGWQGDGGPGVGPEWRAGQLGRVGLCLPY